MQTAPFRDLGALGPAAVGPVKLAAMAAASLHEPTAEVLSVGVAEISGPLANMTTGGLWRVAGMANAGAPAAATGFSIIVKLLQSPVLWLVSKHVPEQFHGSMERGYPWRTEAQVYSSALAQSMPGGGRLPEVYGIEDIDHQHNAIWMEDVAECADAQWTDERFRHAAALLGRLAGNKTALALGRSIPAARGVDRLRLFVDSVGAQVLIPGLMGEDLWRIPAVAEAASPELVQGLRSLAGRAHHLVDEIATLPSLPAHGDASPQNLLVERVESDRDGSTQFVVIDWGMFGMACAGFDLGQLLAGWVNQGSMHGRELRHLDPLCLESYCEGLAASGITVSTRAVRRGHALSMAVFTGLTAVASQRLDEPDSDDLRAFTAGRVEMARFVLDLLASTD